ncbi:hypothetical protein JVX93_18175 [Mycolicibacterium boenickei]|nr:hypothetical protein JVX93_18175 [Mycolicibacterium boenickei]
MDRIFQWVWDRYGPAYSWAICALIYPPGLLIYLGYSFTSRPSTPWIRPHPDSPTGGCTS